MVEELLEVSVPSDAEDSERREDGYPTDREFEEGWEGLKGFIRDHWNKETLYLTVFYFLAAVLCIVSGYALALITKCNV